MVVVKALPRQEPTAGVLDRAAGERDGETAAADAVAAQDDTPLGQVDPLLDLARAALRRRGAAGWRISSGDFWCGLEPPGHQMRLQGWKLHLSATPLSAPTVLARAADLLVAHGCAFKFAGNLDRVEQMVSAHYDRSAAGKFITAYPRDDDQARLLADELHRATCGLPGPEVLSDRRYCPGSLVHYRYGAFAGVPVISNDGGREVRLTAPDGTLVKDQRLPRFSPPPWAEPLLLAEAPADPAAPDTTAPGTAAAPTATTAAPRPVLLAGRFAVREAIRHATKGGVFRATDTHSGEQVVIKQARPCTAATPAGSDARTALRREADMLRAVQSTGIAPKVVAFFEQDENSFLVQELVPGLKLRDWVGAEIRPTAEGGSGTTPAQVLRLASGLTDLLDTVHATGLVFRDFTPNNVMVTPDGTLQLIDFEFAARPATGVTRAFTYGYAPPEQAGGPRFGPAPQLTADLYALGATVLFTATGMDPVLAEDDSTVPADHTPHRRLAELVRAAGLRNPAARLVAPLVLGLTEDAPERRWDLRQVRDFLRETARTAARPGRQAPVPGTDAHAADKELPGADEQERLIAEGLEHILRTMRPDARERLWPSGHFGESTDPCNVQHGASGVLSVLIRAARVRADERLREAVRTASGWITDRVLPRTEPLPGLYFGSAGPAWALAEAGLLLNDGLLQEQACELAARIPLRWPNPDVCHGAAGAGMTQLRMWRATGDSLFADRVRACADGLLAAAQEGRHGPLWPVPESFDSQLAGLVHYGFAHGVAGIGSFLLDAGVALGDDSYLEAARAAASTLTAAAQDDGSAALWPDGPTASRRPATHWCSGSSGIGTFLVRLWCHTRDPLHRELSEHAAEAVRRATWRSSTALCHGLSGDGEFLLDLAHILDDARYRRRAGELALALHLRATHRHGRLLVPDESGITVTCDQGTGLAGPVGFLLRLRHGGPRPWMPETAPPA